MAHSKDHAELVAAIQSGNNSKVAEEWSKLHPVLKSYLIGTMNASPEDAEDCIQQSMFTLIEKVNDGSIVNPEKVKSYMFQCCKRNYFRIIERKRREFTVDEMYTQSAQAEQIERLVDIQNKELMLKCLEKLPEESRWLIYETVYKQEKSLSDLAHELQISANALWTRKHRIINKLIDCVQKVENTV